MTKAKRVRVGSSWYRFADGVFSAGVRKMNGGEWQVYFRLGVHLARDDQYFRRYKDAAAAARKFVEANTFAEALR